MAKFRAFGVGCFYFNYKKAVPFKFDSVDYFKDVEQTLRSLPSLDELQIDFDENSRVTADIVESLPSINDPGFLHLHFYRIEFIVRIPARVARDLFPEEKHIDRRVGTEQFRIVIRDGYRGPVAFVECLDPASDCEPSSAVRLIREFLSREFDKVSGPITFEFLGPAPFHADFFIRQSEHPGRDFELKVTAQKGYDVIEFFCGAELTLEDAIDDIYGELIGELDVFYDFHRLRSSLFDAGGKLVEEWNRARLLFDRPTSMWNLIGRVRVHQAARSVAMLGYSLQARIDVDEKEMVRSVNSLYAKGVRCYLEPYLRALRVPEYPIASIIKWAERVEDGSFKQAEIQAVVASALAGGVIGSLVTKFF